MKNNEPTSGTTIDFEWAVSIFAARESSSELLLTIDAVISAAIKPTVIDVLVNGNLKLAKDIAAMLQPYQSLGSRSVIRVWSIKLGDKAHAWNQYVHLVAPNAKLYFFVDGYVRMKLDALQLLDDGLVARAEALGATGVPTTGRTATVSRQRMLIEGGIQGNLFALKTQSMHALRQAHFNLPLGIYRTDATLGAVLAFGLDPSRNKWDLKGRVFVHPQATWTTSEKKWWRYAELNSQFKRMLRQSQGVLENEAVKDFLAVQRRAPRELPRTASELVLDWAKNHPDEVSALLWKTPLTRFALKKFLEPRDWTSADILPELIFTVP